MIKLPQMLEMQFAKLSEHHLLRALDEFLLWSLEIGVSDIHLEPQGENLHIRIRVDGILHLALALPVRFATQILARLKMLAELDLAEKRLPQDGRFKLELANKNINGRISTCPTVLGEKAVIRLLPITQNYLSLAEQGMTMAQQQALKEIIASPHGLVIVTGPTGSGKTMTLYSLLMCLNDGLRNLITIEDPVEIILPGLNQVQIQEKVGLDFKTILRSLLRQDPDVLMIGEIRDFETAEIAIKAAQTGHLVLSTLHTASAQQAILRLEQLGIPRYLIVEATRLIIAQRLVRKLCPPCAQCLNGFRGRTGIFELLAFTQMVQAKLLKQKELELHDYIDAMNLLEAGFVKVNEGLTTENEVKRVV